MKLSEAFPSKWLKADDMDEADMVLTITDARLEKISDKGDEVPKLILSFKEEEKELICNKTNSRVISNIHGGDTDEWIGKRIALYATEVEFGGETMMGIRVRLKAPRAAGSAAATAGRAAGPQGFGVKKPAPATVPADEPDMAGGGDEDLGIPF